MRRQCTYWGNGDGHAAMSFRRRISGGVTFPREGPLVSPKLPCIRRGTDRQRWVERKRLARAVQVFLDDRV